MLLIGDGVMVFFNVRDSKEKQEQGGKEARGRKMLTPKVLFRCFIFLDEKMLSVFWVIFTFSAFFAFSAGGASAAEPVGRADSVQPGFWAIRGGNRTDLENGGEIFEYDILETDQTGYARVTFADQSVLEIGGGGRIDVMSVVFSYDRNRFNVGVMQGAARVVTGEIVKRNPNNFKIATPKSTIGIRGTTILVEVRETFEKVTVEAIGEGHAVNYSSRATRDSWTMTRPGDTVTVSSPAPSAPPVTVGTPPAGSIAPSEIKVEAVGEGVLQGERDVQGMDKSGAGDNPREAPQGTQGSESGGDERTEHESSGPGSGGGARDPADECCGDNSVPGNK
jgi:hypothetical protein